jgi:hypothetical protein
MNLTSIKSAMDACEQTPGLSVFQHGILVRDHFLDLHRHLSTGSPLEKAWRLPDWIGPDLLDHLLPIETLARYQIWHDCGKPFCLQIDEEGRRHFPDHARASHDTWLAAGGDEQTARLILMDMDIHLLKAEGIEEFAARPEAISLLLTGLSEIHANASMFGGIESTSFKIKWKQIDRRGAQIAKIIRARGQIPKAG